MVLIAQITDTHITRDGRQAGYLSDAIGWINAMRPQPEAVLVSGDTVDGGEREEYAVLRDILGRCVPDVYVVPGNHDRRQPLRDILPEAYYPGTQGERLNFAVEAETVRIVGLDTSQPYRPGGYVDDASLAWLQRCLSDAPARPTLLFMHHPPFRTGVNAADLLGFKGLARLREIVGRHPAVRRIIAGHIHCERRAAIGQAIATTSISSTPQRVPELFERRIFGLRPEAPGFATHAWRDGNFISTTYINAGGSRFVERAAR